MNLNFIVTDDKSNRQAENRINNGQHKLQPDYIRQMFGEQKIMLGNIPVVVIGNSHSEQDVENHGKIKQRKIKPVTLVAHQVLHGAVDPKNPKRLD